MGYNKFLYHANPRLPNRELHAVPRTIPLPVLEKLIQFMLTIDRTSYSAVEIYRMWTAAEDVCHKESFDYVLQLIDFISACQQEAVDLSILLLIVQEEQNPDPVLPMQDTYCDCS